MNVYRVKFNDEYITMPLTVYDLFNFFLPTREDIRVYHNENSDRTYTYEELDDKKIYNVLLAEYRDGFLELMETIGKTYPKSKYEYGDEVYEIIRQDYYDTEGKLKVSDIFNSIMSYVDVKSKTPVYEWLLAVKGEIERLRDIEKMYDISLIEGE